MFFSPVLEIFLEKFPCCGLRGGFMILPHGLMGVEGRHEITSHLVSNSTFLNFYTLSGKVFFKWLPNEESVNSVL